MSIPHVLQVFCWDRNSRKHLGDNTGMWPVMDRLWGLHDYPHASGSCYLTVMHSWKTAVLPSAMHWQVLPCLQWSK